MRLIQFGETVLPELNGNDDFSQSARTNLVPLKYGAIDLDNSEVVLNYKQIQRTATINTDFDDTMDDLAYEAQKGARILKAEMRDGTERQLLAKMNMFSRGAKAQNYTCEQEFGLQWTATYPYWLDSEHEPYYTDHGYDTSMGLSTADANQHSETINTSPVNFTITNNSRVRIAKVYFELSLVLSSVNRPLITNNTNGMYIYVNRPSIGSTGLGDRGLLAIDCLAKKIFCSIEDIGQLGTVGVNGIGEHNYYQYLQTSPDHMDWMILEPGDNDFTFSYSASGGNPQILNILWSSHYV